MNSNKSNRYNIFFQVSIFVISVTLVVFFMPRDGKFNYRFNLNSQWKYGRLTATFDFPILKSPQTIEDEKDSLLRNFIPYFDKSKTIGEAKIDSFARYFYSNDSVLPASYYYRYISTLKSIYETGVISVEDESILAKENKAHIMVAQDNSSEPMAVDKLFTEKTAYQLLTKRDTSAFQQHFLHRYNLNNFIVPNIIYNEQRSKTAEKEILSGISLSSGFILSGQKIIDRGELVDKKMYRILESMRTEWNLRLSNDGQVGLILAGQITFTIIVTLLLFVYINLFRKDFLEHKRKLLLLFTATIFFIIVVALMMRYSFGNVFMLPLAMVPMILRVFMDSRTAFVGHIIMVLLCSIMLNYPYEFILLQTVAGITAIYSLRELSQRSQLFRSALLVFLSYSVTFFAYELIQENDIEKVNYAMYIYFAINGLLLLFTYPLMYLIEKAFGFTSNVTLVELSNINTPLLRELSETTPGTFQHSMQVSNLAAEAAHRIGAHSQLVRTAALYHDIGKMQNPIYFTENQQGINMHETLSYQESAKIIISHVADGVKLAEKHHLPQIIKDFIWTHHGKGKTNYFYISYKNEHPGESFDESVFTYPGPNPFTSEMAILMMADAVEAASKSLKEYTNENIGNMVDKIIDNQIKEGFFTECPITFKEISTIKTVFKERLKSIYHTRINYPEEKSAADTQPAETSK